jgi:hypothetical protein
MKERIMAEEVKPKMSPKPKVEKTAEKPAEEVAVVKEVEIEPISETVVESIVAEEAKEDADSDVEAMGRRGRKSKAEIAEEHKRTREDIESNFANLIAHEPAKADLFREELRKTLQDLGL